MGLENVNKLKLVILTVLITVTSFAVIIFTRFPVIKDKLPTVTSGAEMVPTSDSAVIVRTKPAKSVLGKIPYPVDNLDNANKFLADTAIFPQADHAYLHALFGFTTQTGSKWIYSFSEITNPVVNPSSGKTVFDIRLRDITIKSDQTYTDNIYSASGQENATEEIDEEMALAHYFSLPKLSEIALNNSLIETAETILKGNGFTPGDILRLNYQKCQKCAVDNIVMEAELLFPFPQDINKDEIRIKRVRFRDNVFYDVNDLTVPKGIIYL